MKKHTIHPKVSIIIPIFNVQNYLEECLQSVLLQTLKEIEIICIDDGSTDQSLSILNRYAQKDSRIKIFSKSNRGYGHTINLGIEKATGDYIGIVEPDDFILPKMYEVLWNTANKHHLDFVKSDFHYFAGNKNQRITEKVMICPKIFWYGRIWNPSQNPKLLDANLMNVTGIYRLDFLRENNIRLNESPGAAFQDTGLWFQIFVFAQRAMFLPRYFYYIRRDNPHSSVMSPEQIFKISREYDFIYSFLLQHPEIYKNFSSYFLKKKISAYLFSFSNISRAAKEAFMPQFAKEIKEAEKRDEICEKIFDRSMLSFLKQIKEWKFGQTIPFYQPSQIPWIRLYECAHSNGLFYTVKHFLIKCKLIKKVF